jgi:hypothetical protein
MVKLNQTSSSTSTKYGFDAGSKDELLNEVFELVLESYFDSYDEDLKIDTNTLEMTLKSTNTQPSDVEMWDEYITEIKSKSLITKFKTKLKTYLNSFTYGSGFMNKAAKKKHKAKLKARPRPRYNIIGRGAISPDESQVTRTHKGKFLDLNKFVIDADRLSNNEVLIRYPKNGKKKGDIFQVSDDIRDMIMNIGNNKFDMNRYMSLSKSDKKQFCKFCDMCHMDIGLPNDFEDEENQYKIYLGSHEAGNSEPILKYLLDQYVNKKTLSKINYLEALKIISQKI